MNVNIHNNKEQLQNIIKESEFYQRIYFGLILKLQCFSTWEGLKV